MKRVCACFALFALLGASAVQAASQPQTSAFTYQGHLLQNGTPTSGTHNFVFTLWNAASGGEQIGTTITQANYPVAGGVFNIDLDFGADVFNGMQRYLDVNIDGQELSPRQPVTATPVAAYAMSAAGGAVSVSGTTSGQFSNDHLYAGVALSGQGNSMVMIASPKFSPGGASQVSGYSGDVDVLSLTSELRYTNGSGSSGTPSAVDVRVLAKIDAAYAGLMRTLLVGGDYDKLQIDVLATSSAGSYVAQSYCYGNVQIMDLQPMPQTGAYEMTLLAGMVGIRVARVNGGGVVSGSVQTGWNFVTNKELASAPCVQ